MQFLSVPYKSQKLITPLEVKSIRGIFFVWKDSYHAFRPARTLLPVKIDINGRTIIHNTGLEAFCVNGMQYLGEQFFFPKWQEQCINMSLNVYQSEIMIDRWITEDDAYYNDLDIVFVCDETSAEYEFYDYWETHQFTYYNYVGEDTTSQNLHLINEPEGFVILPFLFTSPMSKSVRNVSYSDISGSTIRIADSSSWAKFKTLDLSLFVMSGKKSLSKSIFEYPLKNKSIDVDIRLSDHCKNEIGDSPFYMNLYNYHKIKL